MFESIDTMNPAALIANIDNTSVSERNTIMETNVSVPEPYLSALIIDCLFVTAMAILYVMWKHIDCYLGAEAIAAVQRDHHIDCAGPSLGRIFCGLLFLVASISCLIYLPDVAYYALSVLSILVIPIGFKRVQSLEFLFEEQWD